MENSMQGDKLMHREGDLPDASAVVGRQTLFVCGGTSVSGTGGD